MLGALVAQEGEGNMPGEQNGRTPDMSAVTSTGLMSTAQQPQKVNFGGSHLATNPAPSRGRKRRSSSFDIKAAKQGIAHRKTSSFDTAMQGTGLQHSKPDSLIGSHSRVGPGFVGGNLGMAGAGTSEVQVGQIAAILACKKQAIY